MKNNYVTRSIKTVVQMIEYVMMAFRISALEKTLEVSMWNTTKVTIVNSLYY
jgi:hypothetical protein